MRSFVRLPLVQRIQKLEVTSNFFFKLKTSGQKGIDLENECKTSYFIQFRVTVVSDTQTVEICGALKNIVACAAGFCDGLKMGDNTRLSPSGWG